MPLPYAILGNFTGSIFSGSFLNEQDTSLFYTSQSADLFFGYSDRDVTELSVNDTFDNAISWSVIDQSKVFNQVTLTYIDALNNLQSYTYNELVSQFIIYRSKAILVDPINDLASVGVTDGAYKVSYTFTRNMAGNVNSHLSINDISPTRTEIKLIPKGSGDNIPYTAFCLKKFPISDISPLLLSITQNCPYDNIYKAIYSQYKSSILFLQSIFFLPDDASVVRFLKNLYEDFIKYTSLTQEQIDSGIDPTRVYRIQGIKSYFNNYLLQGNNIIADFNDIEQQFNSFVNLRIEQAFSQYKEQTGQDYKNAKQFCFDFFSKFFYGAAVHPIQAAHQDKYFSYFKNVLNFGNNKYFPILTHGFLDERQSPSDPLTLIVKLGAELPLDINIKDECWVSNFGMVPFEFTTLLQNPVKFQTLKIGPPNFGTPTKFINEENVNKLYSSDDLALADTTVNDIAINKAISALNTDFSDFNNFVVFSSAVARVNIFKNKAISYYTLSSSLSEVETKYLNSLSSSVVYPYYLTEKNDIQGQINDLISSFDAYESYLFDSGNYFYAISSGSFLNTRYVTDYDTSASVYDKYNRDSLINNTPEYILNDSNNQDYLTFLAMVGHHFDNIYTYISALPIERQAKNQISSSIPTNTLKELLYSFGWDVDDIVSSLNIDQVYLNSLNAPTYNVLSAQERLKIIWNRILVSLPGIYKTKGTEECVKFLMACYGLPTSLISIREYGGTDFSLDPSPTYKLDEKTYMLKFSGVSDRVEGPMPSSAQTVEFKFAVESGSSYQDYQRVSLFTLYPYGNPLPAYSIDIYRVPGEFTGKVVLQMKSGSTGAYIVSDPLPIFNGEIFSVMVRKNDIDSNFEFNIDENAAPRKYDLTVQRNEDGRKIFYSTSSAYFYAQDNRIFSQFGRFSLSDGTYIGTLDKLSIWNLAIDNNDFEEHVNDINSYGFSGSAAFENLWVRIGWDYPQNVHTGSPSAMWLDNRSTFYAIPNYRTSTYLSSSIVPSEFSASQAIIQSMWQASYPTGSVDIQALNFPAIIDPNWSASFNGCNFISNSVYPFSFREFEYQQDIDGSKYGPNKFKNKKIRKISYDVEARFDSDDRSTFDSQVTVTGESNQLGFFIDPQDSKNKDILRYVGRSGIMELIADPRNLYSDKYYDLIKKNYEYNSLGNKRTLFNEMLTVFKFYFDKSIFEAIKNVMPARANLFTGVVVEPTILERPKYQNRPIQSGIQISYEAPGVLDQLYNLSTDILWGEFPSGSFIGYQQSIDLSRVTKPNRIMPANLENMIGGYVTDFMDKVQLGHYADFEIFPRQWEAINAPGGWPQDPVQGSTAYDLNSDGRLIISQSARAVNNFVGLAPDPYITGWNTGSHQIIYYLVKIWDRYKYFAKTGEYVKTENPAENLYSSASVYLYKYAIVAEPIFRNWVYVSSQAIPYDPSLVANAGLYTHYAGTFRGTPNLKVSNVYLIPGLTFPGNLSDYTLGIRPASEYYELPRGYPRNHYTHKMTKFSKTKYGQFIGTLTNVIYVKGRNTIDSTVNENGINDGTYPVTSNNVSNVNVVNTGNVIQFVPSTNAGTLIPGARANTISTTGTGGTGTTTTTPPSTGGTPVGGTTGGGTPPPTGGTGGGGGGGCLIAGTQIRLPNGSTKNVEDVQVGDILQGYNTLVKVQALKPNRWNEFYIINRRLRITWEHPVLIKRANKEIFAFVRNIFVGDRMIRYDGSTELITSIDIVSGETPTYNFIVDGNHTYIADDIVVHNPTVQKF